MKNKYFNSRLLTHRLFVENIDISKRYTGLNRIFSKRILELSPKCNDVLLRNYLIMKREKSLSKTSKTSSRQTVNFVSSSRLYKNRDSYKSRKSFYTNKHNPFVFTNWKEVSRRKEFRYKNVITDIASGALQCKVNYI